MASIDVTILGAGVFGLSIAWACQKRGARVRVIDPHGVAAGASGGIVGALAPHVPENWNDKKAFQLDSLLMAEQFWQEIEAASGQQSGYGRTGRLQPITDARALELAQARARTASELWGDNAVWQVVDAGAAWAPPSATGRLIYDSLSARIHPRRACTALATALCEGGADIVAEGRVAGQVVDCTGWQGLMQLSAEMGQPVGNGVKGQAMLLQYDASDAPQLFADALHIVPHNDGTVAIGSTSEREFEHPTTVDAALDDVHARAIRAFPILADAPVIKRWAGVRPRCKSRAPMLGAHPQRTGGFIANGGFKIGFGMAPKVAQVMADLVLEGRDRIPAGFRPEASLGNGGKTA